MELNIGPCGPAHPTPKHPTIINIIIVTIIIILTCIRRTRTSRGLSKSLRPRPGKPRCLPSLCPDHQIDEMDDDDGDDYDDDDNIL